MPIKPKTAAQTRMDRDTARCQAIATKPVDSPDSFCFRRAAPSKEEKIREVMHLIRRNLPDGPTTFGPCAHEVELPYEPHVSARGGGPCILCCQRELAALTNPAAAVDYVNACRNLRSAEDQLLSP